MELAGRPSRVWESFILKFGYGSCLCPASPALMSSLLLVPLFNVSCSDWLSCSLCHVPFGLFLSCDPPCLL